MEPGYSDNNSINGEGYYIKSIAKYRSKVLVWAPARVYISIFAMYNVNVLLKQDSW